MQRSIRFPDDLAAVVEREARALDRSFSWVVVNAVRRQLGDAPASPVFPVESENLTETPEGRVVAADPAKPVRYEEKRPPVPPARPKHGPGGKRVDPAVAARMAGLNKAKGL